MASYSYLSPSQMRAVEDFRRRAGVDRRDPYTVPRLRTGGESRPTQTLASRPYMSGPELYRNFGLTDARRMGGTARAGSTPRAGAGILSLIKSLYGEGGSRREYVQPFIDIASDASEAATSGLATLKRISKSDPLRPGSRLSALLSGADDLGASAGEAVASNILPIALTRPRSGEQLAGLDPAAVRMSAKAGPDFNAAVPAPVRSIQRGAPDSLASMLEGPRRAPSFRPFPARPGSARLAPTSGADAVRRARPTPPISGGPVETDPEKIARVIASRPRRETPSEAISRGDAQAAIFSAGGDPKSEHLAAEIDRTLGATLRGEALMRRLDSGRLVSVAPGLSNTRQVDTSGGRTVGDQTLREVFPSAVPAVGARATQTRGSSGSISPEALNLRKTVAAEEEKAKIRDSAGERGDVFGLLQPWGDHRMRIPSAIDSVTRPPSPAATKRPPKTSRVSEDYDIEDYDIGASNSAVSEEAMSVSEDSGDGAMFEDVGTKIATTPAEDLNNNEKAVKKGFFENANMGMVEFGLRMAAAASKPGATALGAAAEAGVAMIDNEALLDAKKADRDFKESLQKGLIDARESEGKKDRKSRLTLAESEAKSLFARQRELLRSREETAGFKLEEQIRANKATEAYYLKNLASKSAGQKSASLNSQRTYLGELVKIAGNFAKADSIRFAAMDPAEALAGRMKLLSSGVKSLMGSDLARGIDPSLLAEITKEHAETELGGAGGGGAKQKVMPKVGDTIRQIDTITGAEKITKVTEEILAQMKKK